MTTAELPPDDPVIAALRRAAEQLHASANVNSNANASGGGGGSSNIRTDSATGSISSSNSNSSTSTSTSKAASKYARPAGLGLGLQQAKSSGSNSSTPKESKESPEAAAKAAADAAFLSLLVVSRGAHAATRSAKNATGESKARLDDATLREKNLMYERDHLRREIAKTRAVEYIYQDIALHPLPEFTTLAHQAFLDSTSDNTREKWNGEEEEEEEGEKMDQDRNDVDAVDLSLSENDHQLMLNRLRFELRERKRLKAHQDALLATKQRLLKENEAKKLELEALDKDLEAFLKGSLVLQDRLTVDVTRKRVECAEAQNLARPLFVVYQEVLSWNDLHPDDLIIIEIIGRDANAMDVDDAGGDSTSKPEAKHGKSKSHSSTPHNQKDETSIKLILTTKSSYKTNVILHFHYLPKRGFTIVEPPTLTSITPTSISPKPTFSLTCLLPNDTGLESPNPANNTSRASSNNASSSSSSFSAFSPKESGGFAYHWVQRLSGLMFPHLLPLPADLNIGLFEFIIENVRRRVVVLEEVVDALRAVFLGKKSVAVDRFESAVGGKKRGGGARVIGWKDVLDVKNKFVFACQLASEYPETSAKFSFVEHVGTEGGDASTEATDSINDLLHI
ncbi:UNVERIFIED_CONTAM: THO complex subunit 5, partial [Siphonaria sp. JEL0065]